MSVKMKIFSNKKVNQPMNGATDVQEKKISILDDIVNPRKSRILRNISNIFLENLET